MKTYVCWVCMKDFSNSESLVKHETSKKHLKLVFKQAMKLDIDPADKIRTEKRTFLAGVNDVPDDDQFQEVSKRGKLTFCRCILGWKVGSCSKCDNEEPNKDLIQKRVFASVIESHEIRMGMEDRRKTLGKGLENALKETSYDPLTNRKKIKPDQPIGLSTLVKFLTYKINQKIRIPDPEFRKRSPLVSSKIRAKSMTKVHVMGKTVKNPSLLVVAPSESVNDVARRITTKLSKNAQPSPDQISPLLPSHERKSVLKLGDNIEALRDRAVTRVGPYAKRTTAILLPKSNLKKKNCNFGEQPLSTVHSNQEID